MTEKISIYEIRILTNKLQESLKFYIALGIEIETSYYWTGASHIAYQNENKPFNFQIVDMGDKDIGPSPGFTLIVENVPKILKRLEQNGFEDSIAMYPAMRKGATHATLTDPDGRRIRLIQKSWLER